MTARSKVILARLDHFIDLICGRYSLLLTDTVKVGEEKGVCLTEGIKTFKDVLFSFNVGFSFSLDYDII